jgi:hypothetical protein
LRFRANDLRKDAKRTVMTTDARGRRSLPLPWRVGALPPWRYPRSRN